MNGLLLGGLERARRGLERGAQAADGFADQRRFSRTGRGEDVDDQNAARPEEAAVSFGEAVVLLKDGVPQLQRLTFFRAGFVKIMMAGMLVVAGASGVVIVMLIMLSDLDFVSSDETLFLTRERVDYGNALPQSVSIANQPACVVTRLKVMRVSVHG